MIKKIDHIGVVANKIDDLIDFMRFLGLEKPNTVGRTDAYKVNNAFFKIGDIDIELIEPAGEDDPVSKFIKESKTAIHHIALEVDDIEAELKRFKENGYELIDEEPQRALRDMKAAFIHPKSTKKILIELIEYNHKNL